MCLSQREKKGIKKKNPAVRSEAATSRLLVSVKQRGAGVARLERHASPSPKYATTFKFREPTPFNVVDVSSIILKATFTGWWLIDCNAALASVCSEANVMHVYASLLLPEKKKICRPPRTPIIPPLASKKKSHFSARNKMLPTTQGRVTGLNLSENKTDESLFIPIIITLTSFFFLHSSRGWALLWAGCSLWRIPRHARSSWAMTREREKPAGPSRYRLRFIEPELVSGFWWAGKI